MRKQINLLTPAQKASKLTPTYWREKVFRPTYQRDGERVECGEWYCQIQHAGRREKIATATNSREEAGRKAAALYQLIRSKGWDTALGEFQPQRLVKPKLTLTIGDWLEAVRPLLDVRERTFGCYAYALRKIASEALGEKAASRQRFDPVSCPWRKDADRILLEKLTPEKVREWKAGFVAASGEGELVRQRQKRNANSFVRNARALFGRKLLAQLAKDGVRIPAPTPFDGVELEDRSGSTRYISTIDARKLTQAARAELLTADGDSYVVFLLALGAGLRRGEIDALQWQQVDFERGEIRVVSTAAHALKTEDSEGRVFVDAGLLAELKPFAARATGLYVVESATPMRAHAAAQFYRAAATFNRLTAWLRAHGVVTDKPLHALRKEFGSLICEAADIHTASRQLRHSNISTTANFYTDQRRRVAPAIGAMLANEGKG